MTNFHLVDNNLLDQKDKFAKLCPLFDQLNEKFLNMAILEAHIVDETVVPHYSGHRHKQFIHGKPIIMGGVRKIGIHNLGTTLSKCNHIIGEKYKELGFGVNEVHTHTDTVKRK